RGVRGVRGRRGVRASSFTPLPPVTPLTPLTPLTLPLLVTCSHMKILPLLLLGVCAVRAAPAQQLSPPSTGGIVALDRMLAHLASNKRVLVIAAHPDDENNEFMTLISRGQGVDAAYLSLSRGEGGQNLIGNELGEGLGL